MNYPEYYAADFRKVILDVLAATDTEVDIPVLRSAVAEVSIHDSSIDHLVNQLKWLRERRLVRLTGDGGAYSGATITTAGADVAAGRERAHGVNHRRETRLVDLEQAREIDRLLGGEPLPDDGTDQ